MLTLFLISPDGGNSWLEPVKVSDTGVDQSWLDPRNWVPNGTGPLNDILNRPESVAGIVGWDTVARAGAGGPLGHHLRYGGDYWTVAASAKGFVALWEDNAENGKHQLWARIIRVAGKSSTLPSLSTRSRSVTEQPLSAQSKSGGRESQCRSTSQPRGSSRARVRGPTVIDVLNSQESSRLLSLTTEREHSYAEIVSRQSVFNTHKWYRKLLEERGFQFVLSDYEGFEAELFGPRGDSTILVRILNQCVGSLALVNPTN